jgi:hypothetical protein
MEFFLFFVLYAKVLRIQYFWMNDFVAIISKDSQSASNAFLIPILNLCSKNFCIIFGFFANFEAKNRTKRIKKTKHVFYKSVLELHFASTSGLSILGKKSKSLHSMVQYDRLQPHSLLHTVLTYRMNITSGDFNLKFWLSELLRRKNNF